MRKAILPMSYIRNASKMKYKFYNEKYLILLLLFLSVLTVFIILMNLPSDIQRVVNKDSIKNVFVPEVNLEVNHHNDNHQHPAPPLYHDIHKDAPKQIEPNVVKDVAKNDVPKTNSAGSTSDTAKRDKIKEVNIIIYLKKVDRKTF